MFVAIVLYSTLCYYIYYSTLTYCICWALCCAEITFERAITISLLMMSDACSFCIILNIMLLYLLLYNNILNMLGVVLCRNIIRLNNNHLICCEYLSNISKDCLKRDWSIIHIQLKYDPFKNLFNRISRCIKYNTPVILMMSDVCNYCVILNFMSLCLLLYIDILYMLGVMLCSNTIWLNNNHIICCE